MIKDITIQIIGDSDSEIQIVKSNISDYLNTEFISDITDGELEYIRYEIKVERSDYYNKE